MEPFRSSEKYEIIKQQKGRLPFSNGIKNKGFDEQYFAHIEMMDISESVTFSASYFSVAWFVSKPDLKTLRSRSRTSESNTQMDQL